MPTEEEIRTARVANDAARKTAMTKQNALTKERQGMDRTNALKAAAQRKTAMDAQKALKASKDKHSIEVKAAKAAGKSPSTVAPGQVKKFKGKYAGPDKYKGRIPAHLKHKYKGKYFGKEKNQGLGQVRTLPVRQQAVGS